jgi:hypothetical protein
MLEEAGFNALDFSKQDKVKFIGGECQFNSSVFNT